MDQAGAPTAAYDLAGRPTLSPRSAEQVAFQEAIIADISRSLLGLWWTTLRVGIAKLTRRPQPVPFWVAVLCVALITLGLSASLAAVFGETAILQLEPFGEFTLWVGYTALFASVMQSQLNGSVYLLNTTVLESLATAEEINSLRRFFARALHWRWQLVCCVGYSIGIALLCTYFVFYLTGNGFPISATVLYAVNFFQIGMYTLFLVIFIAAFLRLRTMNLRMYQGDPSASPVIHRLYRVSSRLMFAIAIILPLLGAVLGGIGTIIDLWHKLMIP